MPCALMKKWLSAKKLSASTAVAAAKTASTGAMDKMMKDMDVKPMGNADVDFAKGMVPHHQGAVAMANIELQYGTDADVKKLAEGVVKSQSEEITQMKAWLASHGG